jgi:hypothetical protein
MQQQKIEWRRSQVLELSSKGHSQSEKPVCVNGYGCDCEELHLVNCKNGMTIIAIALID